MGKGEGEGVEGGVGVMDWIILMSLKGDPKLTNFLDRQLQMQKDLKLLCNMYRPTTVCTVRTLNAVLSYSVCTFYLYLFTPCWRLLQCLDQTDKR